MRSSKIHNNDVCPHYPEQWNDPAMIWSLWVTWPAVTWWTIFMIFMDGPSVEPLCSVADLTVLFLPAPGQTNAAGPGSGSGLSLHHSPRMLWATAARSLWLQLQSLILQHLHSGPEICWTLWRWYDELSSVRLMLEVLITWCWTGLLSALLSCWFQYMSVTQRAASTASGPWNTEDTSPVISYCVYTHVHVLLLLLLIH